MVVEKLPLIKFSDHLCHFAIKMRQGQRGRPGQPMKASRRCNCAAAQTRALQLDCSGGQLLGADLNPAVSEQARRDKHPSWSQNSTGPGLSQQMLLSYLTSMLKIK